MAARNFVAWRYTAKSGKVYVRRADNFIVTQMTGGDPDKPKVGGSTAAGLAPYDEMPANIRPRAFLCKEAGVSYRATVVCYDPDAYNDVVLGTTTINVRDGGGATHTCVVLDKRDEAPARVIGA